ncbi:MAG TPA: GNAT family N-acetyltransferase [Oscillatoriaceae cyanobacterium M33_DOE_052]|uniref:GNAT family N-acetyltransferase n=1 Tax=Planktothricoides sp. SpSt-374 TaxID=2282167 RepID=A0A7C3VNF4_9CYAN|nr:GNAT family N-acetyltransferase [Oscillatoriaceae cyanobacterium M33_DOE_052]
MTIALETKPQTTPYTHRQATPEDAAAIAPLWAAFAQERTAADPSMLLKANFDFLQYVRRQLEKPLSYAWVLQWHTDNHSAIVGCLFVYFYDEAPPQELPQEMRAEQELENPFQARRVGAVLGMYVQPEHRHTDTIKLLAEAAIQQAATLKVSDIDILVSAEQTGVQALLQRFGFKKAAVQYTKHFDLTDATDLPSLHRPHPDFELSERPFDKAIPLYDPLTNEIVRNPQGEAVFLMPLADETTGKLPIYPTPVRDPQTQEWIFDRLGELVVCPVLRDENGQVVEYQGIPQFHPPVYDIVDGQIRLQQDAAGNYLFCAIEKDKKGQILRTPNGSPVFKRTAS